MRSRLPYVFCDAKNFWADSHRHFHYGHLPVGHFRWQIHLLPLAFWNFNVLIFTTVTSSNFPFLRKKHKFLLVFTSTLAPFRQTWNFVYCLVAAAAVLFQLSSRRAALVSVLPDFLTYKPPILALNRQFNCAI